MLQTIRIIIYGKVQGVFYRQSAKEKAVAMGVTGTVRNLPNDTVEIVATAAPEQLDEFLRWCRQGPERAVVRHLETQQMPLQVSEAFVVVRG